MSALVRVKVIKRNAFSLSKKGVSPILAPGQAPRFGRCHFISDPFCETYDWLVVIDDLPPWHRSQGGGERAQLTTLKCPREHTLFITTEPASISCYGQRFASQFHWLLTSQSAQELAHPRAIRSHTGNLWFYGRAYNEIVAMTPPPKTELLSTVCSNKQQKHTLHAVRYAFTQYLAQEIPAMQLFGHGVRYIGLKAEALEPYAFHLTIENHLAPHHWTEKIADAFLGFSVPFYYGCTNLAEYFPADSFIPIDLSDFKGAVQTIKQNLTYENYMRRLPAVCEARRLVLEKYNLPALIDQIISQAPAASPTSTSTIELLSRRQMRTHSVAELMRFLKWQLRSRHRS